MRVSSKDDAADGCLDPAQDQIEFDRRADFIPVAGPDIGAEHDDLAPLQFIEQGRR